MTLPALSQEVQWANKVIKFSSDLGGKQNGIKRILGKPDAFPQGGASSNAWIPKNALDGKEVIEVSFEKPQTVKQIAVFENLNAGCVVKIGVDNGSGSYETVWTRKKDWKTPLYKATLSTDRSFYFKKKRRKIHEVPDVFNPGIEYAILDNAVSNTVAVKVEFNFALLPGQKQIDAIGISDSDDLIMAKINVPTTFEELGIAKEISLGNLNANAVILSTDGQKLLFTDDTNEKEIIYSCLKQLDGKWSTPISESNLLNSNETYNYILALYPDFILKGGMNYTRGNGETGYQFLDKNYNSIGLLKIAAFTNYDDTSSATISKDSKTIIMGIETDMTQGGHDLYFTTKKDDGSYGYLQNLGKSLNSAAEESSPFLLSDTKTLFFMSNGYSGFGDYDIYVTYRLDETWKKWSEPTNLGNKVNSSEYEGSPTYDESTETLYFATYVNGKSVLKCVSLPVKILQIKS